MNSSAADKTVTHNTGWVADGHHICWNGHHGAFMGHPDSCPSAVERGLKVYYCTPGFYATNFGITLDDLPNDEAAACREFSHGSEPIRWRLNEIIHPDLSIEEQINLSLFEVQLDTEDEFDEDA